MEDKHFGHRPLSWLQTNNIKVPRYRIYKTKDCCCSCFCFYFLVFLEKLITFQIVYFLMLEAI